MKNWKVNSESQDLQNHSLKRNTAVTDLPGKKKEEAENATLHTPLSSSTWHNTNSFSHDKEVYHFAAPIDIAAVFICWALRKPERTLCANLLSLSIVSSVLIIPAVHSDWKI